MVNKEQKIYDVLSNESGEEVLKLLTDWHGMDLLDDDFYVFLQNEGIIPEDE